MKKFISQDLIDHEFLYLLDVTESFISQETVLNALMGANKLRSLSMLKAPRGSTVLTIKLSSRIEENIIHNVLSNTSSNVSKQILIQKAGTIFVKVKQCDCATCCNGSITILPQIIVTAVNSQLLRRCRTTLYQPLSTCVLAFVKHPRLVPAPKMVWK